MRKKQREEEEERNKKLAENEKKSASIREITQEEYERRKLQEKLNAQKQAEPVQEKISTETIKEVEPKKEESAGESTKHKPGPGNGGSTDSYVWTQHDIKEIGITIPIPSNIKGRDIIFKYTAKDLYIHIKVKQTLIIG
jgi:hypothetical protein